MWNCEEGSEAVDEDFSTCGNCGTARDGTRDLTFQREDSGHHPENQADSGDDNFTTRIANDFECVKCKHTNAEVKRITTLSREFRFFCFPRENRFVAVSCTQCGFAEFYEAKTVGETSLWDRLMPF